MHITFKFYKMPPLLHLIITQYNVNLEFNEKPNCLDHYLYRVMLDLVRKVSMVGGPTFTGRASVRRREKSSGKRNLVIRPRSLLCNMNQEEVYSSKGIYIQRPSDTWKFHRPKSYRYIFFIDVFWVKPKHIMIGKTIYFC